MDMIRHNRQRRGPKALFVRNPNRPVPNRCKTVFIDVLPRPPKPQNLPEGTIWRDKPRFNIPGSIWLPDTGYGALAAVTEDYLRKGLARISRDDPGKWIVIYCLADCWMSWNAAKRTLSDG